MKNCTICNSKEGKYKCPTCLIYYCSVTCCNKHRENKCEISESKSSTAVLEELTTQRFMTPDTVPEKQLKLLAADGKLKGLLVNPHLRKVLQVIDASQNPEEIMQKAMKEPIFIEFADACLNVIKPTET